MFVCGFFVCREVVVMVDVYASGYILFYCSNYIILLCYLYYFNVLNAEIKPLMLGVL